MSAIAMRELFENFVSELSPMVQAGIIREEELPAQVSAKLDNLVKHIADGITPAAERGAISPAEVPVAVSAEVKEAAGEPKTAEEQIVQEKVEEAKPTFPMWILPVGAIAVKFLRGL